jgi:hypothetical protein
MVWGARDNREGRVEEDPQKFQHEESVEVEVHEGRNPGSSSDYVYETQK